MWQEILAVDSKTSKYRGKMAQEKELRPLYLKRRLQLLQQQEQSAADGSRSSGSAGPIRNKRYLSLRVKLLKRQFGLPSDVLSLKSLSLQGQVGPSSADPRLPRLSSFDSDLANENEVMPRSSPRLKDRFAFTGVHHIFDQHRNRINRIKFAHLPSNSFFACASQDGTVSLCDLATSEHAFLDGNHKGPVSDVDLSDSDEFAVSAALDGSLILWDLKSRKQLRHVQVGVAGVHILFCRFLPQNNNLVVCVLSSGFVNIINISTGKFVIDGSGSPVLGASLCCEISPQGNLLWVGNDRGQIESFKLDCEQRVR